MIRVEEDRKYLLSCGENIKGVVRVSDIHGHTEVDVQLKGTLKGEEGSFVRELQDLVQKYYL